eukprot:scaffold111945_cov31-Tisochrysis_lutea.AAC.3
MFELVVNEEQIVCVLTRVANHLLGEWSDSPVGHLVCERERGHLEHAGGLSRVKCTDHVQPEVALEP